MASASNANIPVLSEYQDAMSTGDSNKWGHTELESRQSSNSVADILNGAWTDWTPTVVYGQTGPSNVGASATTTTVAKYMQIGSTVFFKYQCVSGIQSGINVNAATITLPVNPKDDDTYPIVNALQLNTAATYSDVQGYIDMTTGTEASRFIRFRKFQPQITTGTYVMYVNGMYEVT